jgi:predicted RNase H-like HicB family nuclease
MKYPVLLEDGGDGWILARCPTLRGCYAQGETRAEALSNLREVVELTLQARKELGLPSENADFAYLEALEIEI